LGFAGDNVLDRLCVDIMCTGKGLQWMVLQEEGVYVPLQRAHKELLISITASHYHNLELLKVTFCSKAFCGEGSQATV
jgi:hypothetical protein